MNPRKLILIALILIPSQLLCMDRAVRPIEEIERNIQAQDADLRNISAQRRVHKQFLKGFCSFGNGLSSVAATATSAWGTYRLWSALTSRMASNPGLTPMHHFSQYLFASRPAHLITAAAVGCLVGGLTYWLAQKSNFFGIYNVSTQYLPGLRLLKQRKRTIIMRLTANQQLGGQIQTQVEQDTLAILRQGRERIASAPRQNDLHAPLLHQEQERLAAAQQQAAAMEQQLQRLTELRQQTEVASRQPAPIEQPQAPAPAQPIDDIRNFEVTLIAAINPANIAGSIQQIEGRLQEFIRQRNALQQLPAGQHIPEPSDNLQQALRPVLAHAIATRNINLCRNLVLCGLRLHVLHNAELIEQIQNNQDLLYALAGNDEMCAICLENIPENAEHPALFAHRCGHIFCQACIEPWQDKRHNDCPVCHALPDGIHYAQQRPQGEIDPEQMNALLQVQRFVERQ